MPLRPPPFAAANGDRILVRSLLFNAGWLLFDRAFRFVIVFATAILVTRHLGPTGAGLLASATALALIVAGLCDLGLDTIVRLQVIASPERRGGILATALTLRLGVVPPAFALFAWLMSRDAASAGQVGLVVGIGLTLLLPPAMIFDSWFQSQTAARDSVWAQTTALGLGGALRITAVFAEAPVAIFGWIAGIETLATAAALAWMYHYRHDRFRAWRFEPAIALDLLRRAWPLALTNLAILLYSRIDVVLLSTWRGEYDTGLYAAATRISEAGYILPMIAVNTFLPVLARLHASDPAQFKRAFQRLAGTIGWLGIGTGAICAAGAPWIVTLLYGPAFAGSESVLAITAWNAVFASLGAVRSQWLVLNELQRFGLYYVAMGALLNLALNIWLIPRHAAVGAASANLATQAFVVFVAPLLFAPTRPSVALLLRSLLPHRSPPS